MIYGVALSASPPAAAPPAPVGYTVQAGDTLKTIAEQLLEGPAGWRGLSRFNQVFKPYRLQPGQQLRIPFDWLKSQPGEAKVVGVTGESQTGDAKAVKDTTLKEGATITTGETGVVEVELADGTRLRVAPASQVRLERLRYYHDPAIVDARVQIEQGRIDSTSPKQRLKPLQIRTPSATAAVRGTTFRVGVKTEAASTEVLDGNIDWGTPPIEAAASRTRRTGKKAVKPPAAPPAAKVAVAQGFGSSADSSGHVTVPEPLLPAPDLSPVPARFETIIARFELPVVPGARRYRYDIARDAGFSEIVESRVVDQPAVAFASHDDGDHHLRVRAIAASQVEGYDGSRVFAMAARPEPPLALAPAADAIVFGESVPLKWSEAPGATGYRLQIAEDAGFSKMIFDGRVEQAAAAAPFDTSVKGPVERFWRIATVAGEKTGPLSRIRRIQWRPTPAGPAFASAGLSNRLAWDGEPGARYQLEVSRSQQFSPLAASIETETPDATLPVLIPGTYFVRLRTTTRDGVVTPFSAPQRILIRPLVIDGSAAPVGDGQGGDVESSRTQP